MECLFLISWYGISIFRITVWKFLFLESLFGNIYFQNHCMEIRKLKEMEYEIVTSTIKGWEGEVS